VKPLLIFALLLCLLLTGPVAAQDDRLLVWRTWDVAIANLDTRANRFTVTESTEVDFSGTFRFGQHVISWARLDRISGVSVSQDGRPLTAGCANERGTFCAELTSEGTEITYYFRQPITNGTGRFQIEYTVEGALRSYPEGDQLWWIAFPSEHFGFTIERSTITVTMPPGFAPREGIDPVETYGVASEVDVRGAVVTARNTAPITGDQFFEIRVQYPHDPNGSPPTWQPFYDSQVESQAGLDVGFLAVSLLLGLGGPLGVFLAWFRFGRDPKVGVVPEYLSDPPDGLPPAMVGTLIDERADVRDVISTVIDLARRGYLVMEESLQEGFAGIGQTRKFTFKRTDKAADDLRPFENQMLSAVFSGGRMERTLESLQNQFYMHIPLIQHALYQGLVEEGYFPRNPNHVRSLWTMVGMMVTGFGGFGIFASLDAAEVMSSLQIWAALALTLTGVSLLVAARFMGTRTAKGAEASAKWLAFYRYMQNLDKYTEVESAASRFDDLLAYAVCFGLDRAWVRRFSQVPTTPIPTWYYPTYMGRWWGWGYTPGTAAPSGHQQPTIGDLARSGEGGFSLDDASGGLAGGLNSISSGLTTMLNSTSRAMTSVPQNTSSGSSGRWSSGGRSFSGGSSFGGGSGGGRSGFG
jgi:uncharacterized membrane protein YgcG